MLHRLSVWEAEFLRFPIPLSLQSRAAYGSAFRRICFSQVGWYTGPTQGLTRGVPPSTYLSKINHIKEALPMQLTCLNATLSHSLRLVGHAVSSQTPALPVLNHVLLDATHGTLTLAASNLAWHLVHRMPADVVTPGRVTVPATVFTEWVRTLPPARPRNSRWIPPR